LSSPSPHSSGISPYLAAFFGITAASTAAIFIRYAQQEGVPSLVIAACRLSIATLVLAPIALSRRRTELAALTRRELGLALLSGLFLALHFAAWISSLEYTTVASSVVLVTTTPLWVAVLAPFTLREPVTRAQLVGMLAALAGGVVIGVSDAGNSAAKNPLLGDLLALAGAMMAASYILIGRRLRKKMTLISYTFVVYGAAAVILVMIMLVGGYSPLGYPAAAYLWFVLLALIPQLLGHSSINWALGYLSAASVSTILLGEPIGSTILAVILLHETPGVVKILGAVLILAGIYAVARSENAKGAK
jgi:drug/metabolite transporter (DMT)-like permease